MKLRLTGEEKLGEKKTNTHLGRQNISICPKTSLMMIVFKVLTKVEKKTKNCRI